MTAQPYNPESVPADVHVISPELGDEVVQSWQVLEHMQDVLDGGLRVAEQEFAEQQRLHAEQTGKMRELQHQLTSLTDQLSTFPGLRQQLQLLREHVANKVETAQGAYEQTGQDAHTITREYNDLLAAKALAEEDKSSQEESLQQIADRAISMTSDESTIAQTLGELANAQIFALNERLIHLREEIRLKRDQVVDSSTAHTSALDALQQAKAELIEIDSKINAHDALHATTQQTLDELCQLIRSLSIESPAQHDQEVAVVIPIDRQAEDTDEKVIVLPTMPASNIQKILLLSVEGSQTSNEGAE